MRGASGKMPERSSQSRPSTMSRASLARGSLAGGLNKRMSSFTEVVKQRTSRASRVSTSSKPPKTSWKLHKANKSGTQEIGGEAQIIPNGRHSEKNKMAKRGEALSEFVMASAQNLSQDEGDNCNSQHCFHPYTSTFRQCLDLFLCLVASYEFVCIPFIATLGQRNSVEFLVTDALLDSLFFIDMLLNFVTAYYEPNEISEDDDEEAIQLHNLVVDHRTIRQNYLCSGAFFKDLILSFPCMDLAFLGMLGWSAMDCATSDEPGMALIGVRLSRFFLRVLRCMAIRRHPRFNHATHSLTSKPQLQAVLSVIELGGVVFYIFHLVACTFPLIHPYIVQPPDAGPARAYLCSIFYVTMVMVGQGPTIPEPNDSTEDMFSMIVIVCLGAVILGTIFAQVAGVLGSFNVDQRKFVQDMHLFDKAMQDLWIDDDLRDRLRAIYNLQFNVYRHEKRCIEILGDGVSSSLCDDFVLQARAEVLSEFRLLSTLYLKSKPVVALLLKIMHIQIFVKDDTVVLSQTLADQAIFVLRGATTRIDSADGSSQVIAAPFVCGGAALLLEYPVHPDTVIAAMLLETYVLPAEDYKAARMRFAQGSIHNIAINEFEHELKGYLDEAEFTERTPPGPPLSSSEVQNVGTMDTMNQSAAQPSVSEMASVVTDAKRLSNIACWRSNSKAARFGGKKPSVLQPSLAKKRESKIAFTVLDSGAGSSGSKTTNSSTARGSLESHGSSVQSVLSVPSDSFGEAQPLSEPTKNKKKSFVAPLPNMKHAFSQGGPTKQFMGVGKINSNLSIQSAGGTPRKPRGSFLGRPAASLSPRARDGPLSPRGVLGGCLGASQESQKSSGSVGGKLNPFHLQESQDISGPDRSQDSNLSILIEKAESELEGQTPRSAVTERSSVPSPSNRAHDAQDQSSLLKAIQDSIENMEIRICDRICSKIGGQLDSLQSEVSDLKLQMKMSAFNLPSRAPDRPEPSNFERPKWASDPPQTKVDREEEEA